MQDEFLHLHWHHSQKYHSDWSSFKQLDLAVESLNETQRAAFFALTDVHAKNGGKTASGIMQTNAYPTKPGYGAVSDVCVIASVVIRIQTS